MERDGQVGGMVHGVVVQMSTDTSRPATAGTRAAMSLALLESASGNST
jgi:hypothetical protein